MMGIYKRKPRLEKKNIWNFKVTSCPYCGRIIRQNWYRHHLRQCAKSPYLEFGLPYPTGGE